MNIEDIKVGETYNVRVLVKYIEGHNVVAATIDKDGREGYRTRFLFGDLPAFSPISPEPAPKYDPNRKFRKGDIVEVDPHGRDIAASMKKAGLELGKRYAVTEDEGTTGHSIGYVSFKGDDGIEHHSMFFWLKLVIAVEEQEPYYLTESTDFWGVDKDDLEVEAAVFWKKTHPNAKAAAEAECARLNAEYRKEQK